MFCRICKIIKPLVKFLSVHITSDVYLNEWKNYHIYNLLCILCFLVQNIAANEIRQALFTSNNFVFGNWPNTKFLHVNDSSNLNTSQQSSQE